MSKVWFVTGAGRGIGAGVVNAALQAGHRVVATGRNLDTLRRAFPDAPADRIAFVELDVTNAQQAGAAEVEPFGIKVTLVEPGFFRTGLLDPSSVEWAANAIGDYGAPGSVQAEWQPYDGAQTGDPVKLGQAVVKLAGMDAPPKHFLGG